MIVLDTNVISALMRDPPDAGVRAWIDRQVKHSIHTTAVTVFELQVGIALLPAGRRRRILEAGMAAILMGELADRVLGFDRRAAELAAEVFADRRKSGRTVEIRDTQIAGIALAHRASLATFNSRDFADLEIDVVDPRAE